MASAKPTRCILPKKMKLKYRLKDFIKEKVDESYYLSDELVKSFEEHTQRQKAKGNGFSFSPTEGEGTSFTITTREGSRTDDTFLKVSEELGEECSSLGSDMNTHRV